MIEYVSPAENGQYFALVNGEPLSQIPSDLYIPPDSLKVFLEAFEGPLDILLYLIKRQKFDIVEISVSKITKQYMRYIDLMEFLQLDLAGEYLLMAATLTEIKSMMLLPKPVMEDGEKDPRAELVRRLQEYEQYKQGAEKLDSLPRCEREIFPATVESLQRSLDDRQPEITLDMLLEKFVHVLARVDRSQRHRIMRELLSVRDHMTIILDGLQIDSFTDFRQFFKQEEGRAGVIVLFLAILELLKSSLIEMVQNEMNSPIHIKAVS